MYSRVTVVTCLSACLLWGCDSSAPPERAAKADNTRVTEPDKTEKATEPTRPAVAAPPVLQEGPRWICDEPVFNFGETWAGTKVKQRFRFRNGGNETLEILRIKPRCSCSLAQGYSKSVAPGGEGVLPFVLDTTKKLGPVSEYLTITTNDKVQPVMKITLTGIVRTACKMEVIRDELFEKDKALGKLTAPLNLRKGGSFGRIKADDRLFRVIKLRNTSGRPLTLELLPLPTDAVYQAELVETVNGEEFELTLLGEPPFSVGRHTTPIRMRTNIPEQPIFSLNAVAYVPPRVEVVPSKLIFNQTRPPKPVNPITITNNGDTPVDVISVAVSDPTIDVVLLPRHPRRPNQQVLEVEFPGGESYRPPPYGEIIEIRTNDAQWPIIRRWVVPTSKGRLSPRPPASPLIMHPIDISG